MEKSTTINLCVKLLTGILITVGVFVAVPMIMMAAEIIGSRMAPEGFKMPFTLKQFGLDGLEAESPHVLTLYIVSLFFTIFGAVYLMVGKQKAKIERIVSWAVSAIALCVLLPTTRTMLKETRVALAVEEDRGTYMGIKMDEFNKTYLTKNGWTLTKHENCDNNYVRKGEHYSGDGTVGYLDAWNPHGMALYQAEKQQPVEPGTYRIVCAARSEGPGFYVFATTTSGKYGVKLVEVPHYGNTEGEIWENAPEGSAEKEANLGQGFGWSKVVVTIQIDSQDTLIYGVSSDAKFTGKTLKSQWFSAADFEVERLGIE